MADVRQQYVLDSQVFGGCPKATGLLGRVVLGYESSVSFFAGRTSVLPQQVVSAVKGDPSLSARMLAIRRNTHD